MAACRNDSGEGRGGDFNPCPCLRRGYQSQSLTCPRYGDENNSPSLPRKEKSSPHPRGEKSPPCTRKKKNILFTL